MKKIIVLLLFFCPLFAEVGFTHPWGKDQELVPSQSLIPPVPQKRGFMTRLSESVILFHQKILSPVDGPRSHFRPTSSRYMLLAMRRHGFIKGYIMGCDRLLRENREEWVYRKVTIDGKTFKWDPTFSSSKRRSSSKKFPL
ncbi:MAG: membrane protein insertion efficiency factor YidD [Simkaniaceae bacterium]|nr:membrane protein insertion efficiency factor YidD [Simkaniaceae bacterium]